MLRHSLIQLNFDLVLFHISICTILRKLQMPFFEQVLHTFSCRFPDPLVCWLYIVCNIVLHFLTLPCLYIAIHAYHFQWYFALYCHTLHCLAPILFPARDLAILHAASQLIRGILSDKVKFPNTNQFILPPILPWGTMWSFFKRLNQ